MLCSWLQHHAADFDHVNDHCQARLSFVSPRLAPGDLLTSIDGRREHLGFILAQDNMFPARVQSDANYPGVPGFMSLKTVCFIEHIKPPSKPQFSAKLCTTMGVL